MGLLDGAPSCREQTAGAESSAFVVVSAADRARLCIPRVVRNDFEPNSQPIMDLHPASLAWRMNLILSRRPTTSPPVGRCAEHWGRRSLRDGLPKGIHLQPQRVDLVVPLLQIHLQPSNVLTRSDFLQRRRTSFRRVTGGANRQRPPRPLLQRRPWQDLQGLVPPLSISLDCFCDIYSLRTHFSTLNGLERDEEKRKR